MIKQINLAGEIAYFDKKTMKVYYVEHINENIYIFTYLATHEGMQKIKISDGYWYSEAYGYNDKEILETFLRDYCD